jgi:hypothetical protein
MKTLELALPEGQELDLPVGVVVRLAPMRDENGQIFAYWVIDDATDDPLDLVPASAVRAAAE